MSYQCKMCAERGKTWKGQDPQCAFERGEFNPDNWNCATVNAIRDICEPLAVWCEDQNYSTLLTGVSGAEACWVTWYKRRGRTEAMWLLFADKDPRRPTEAECLEIISEAA